MSVIADAEPLPQYEDDPERDSRELVEYAKRIAAMSDDGLSLCLMELNEANKIIRERLMRFRRKKMA